MKVGYGGWLRLAPYRLVIKDVEDCALVADAVAQQAANVASGSRRFDLA
jgi:hypothetical protein